MSGPVTRRPRAETDLVEIWPFIADDNEAAADRALAKIEGVLKMLSEHPLAGRARPELLDALRSFRRETTLSSTFRSSTALKSCACSVDFSTSTRRSSSDCRNARDVAPKRAAFLDHGLWRFDTSQLGVF